MAVGAPLASASIGDAGLQWTGAQTSLLALNVLGTNTVATAAVAITVPTVLTVTNGPGAISGQSAVVTITVDRPAGINLPVGRAHGFGVYRFDSVLSTPAQRSAVYQSAFGVQYGFPQTSFTTTTTLTVAANGTLQLPVVWGLAGNRTGVSISAVATFPVTATIVVGGRTLTSSSAITIPVGAGIL